MRTDATRHPSSRLPMLEKLSIFDSAFIFQYSLLKYHERQQWRHPLEMTYLSRIVFSSHISSTSYPIPTAKTIKQKFFYFLFFVGKRGIECDEPKTAIRETTARRTKTAQNNMKLSFQILRKEKE